MTCLDNLPATSELVIEFFWKSRNYGNICALLNLVLCAHHNLACLGVPEQHHFLCCEAYKEHGHIVFQNLSLRNLVHGS
jgi:hypothetical protein